MAQQTVTTDLPPGPKPAEALRADAERNRERILAAAHRLFSREGLGVSMTAVAREADVGNATLFRRFATKELLIEAVFKDRVDVYNNLVTTCSKNPDPWQGFTDYVQCVCTLQASDPAFLEVLTLTFPDGTVETRRAEAERRVLDLISRAKEIGHLRQDFSERDLTILLMANSGVLRAAGPTSDASRRLTAQLLRAYATKDAPPVALPKAPPRAELYHAMIRLLRGHST
ncbi:TetR/AcrR family transcriptional regulator [Streptomyces sp. VRA16 Mangrove soil]|uniref:TetR/AcrR family transcriptional regulator n=1 Tax=Streptomyces sp. VRA16 Mangrove soil TaxID=2817434 RepID=UPI0027DBD658|nr:TetR/AcrR family transcriptional regulator [Streptomyces sp. VRA16 Mangrove soil]